MKVKIEKIPLTNIFLSCMAVYKKECFGFLFGYETEESFIVTNALPAQTSERHYSEVSLPSYKESRRINDNLETLTDYYIIGDFHSHPDSNSKPSIDDIKTMEIEKDKVYIILSLEEQLKKRKRTRTKDGSIYGSIGDKINFYLTAYAYDFEAEKFSCTKIIPSRGFFNRK